MPLPRHLFEPIPLPASGSKPEGPEAPSEQIAMAPPPADLSERMDKQRQQEAWLKERKAGRAAAERARIERMPVKSIAILGRHASSFAPENALHMYIDITHAEHGKEYHEILEALPMDKDGQSPWPINTANCDAQAYLRFVPGGETDRDHNPEDATRFLGGLLHAPKNTSLTEYAKLLREGAIASNDHLHHYDFLGQQGFNSNAWVSSLVKSIGKKQGVEDINDILKNLASSHTNAHENGDDQAADAMKEALEKTPNRYVAPGFGHAMPTNTFRYDHAPTVDESIYLPNVLKLAEDELLHYLDPLDHALKDEMKVHLLPGQNSQPAQDHHEPARKAASRGFSMGF